MRRVDLTDLVRSDIARTTVRTATLLEWIGVVGVHRLSRCFTCCAVHGANCRRCTTTSTLRIAATAAVPLLGGYCRWWPARLRGAFYLGYSYFAVFYCLVLLAALHAAQEQGGDAFGGQHGDQRRAHRPADRLAQYRWPCWSRGTCSASLCYWITSADSAASLEFMISALDSLVRRAGAGGSISKFGQKGALRWSACVFFTPASPAPSPTRCASR